MADGVLPGGELLAVVGESDLDELADAGEGEALVRRLEDGHGDEGNVGVGRLYQAAGRLLVFAAAFLEVLVARQAARA